MYRAFKMQTKIFKKYDVPSMKGYIIVIIIYMLYDMQICLAFFLCHINNFLSSFNYFIIQIMKHTTSSLIRASTVCSSPPTPTPIGTLLIIVALLPPPSPAPIAALVFVARVGTTSRLKPKPRLI